MKIFNVNFQGEKNSIYCKCENTRNGFKHVATMNYNGNIYLQLPIISTELGNILNIKALLESYTTSYRMK